MSTAARRRLMRDFKVRSYYPPFSKGSHDSWLHIGPWADRAEQRMQTDPPAGVSASPVADNVMTWYGSPQALSTRHAAMSLEMLCH